MNESGAMLLKNEILTTCSKDFLFLFPSDMYCIHPEQCYCKDEDGHYYPPGYSYDFDCQHW